MNTAQTITTIFELLAAAGIITGIIYEPRLVAFEERITAKLKKTK